MILSVIKTDTEFLENDTARVRNTQANSNTERWILGRVVKVCGPKTYLVKTGHKTDMFTLMIKCRMRLVSWT